MTMGSCTGIGKVFGLLGMATPLIAIGAILYLIVAKRKNSDLHEAH